MKEMSLLDKVEYENLNQVLDKNAVDLADKVAVRYEDTSLTYSQFKEKVLKLANVLQGLGAKKGDFIAIQLSNSIEFCVSIYACYRIGAVATPIISLWKTKEVAEAIKHAKTKILIVKASLANIVKKAAKTDPINSIITVGEGDFSDVDVYKGEFWDLVEKAEATDPGVEVKRSDLASCHFTSGTTGQSKGVLHDHLGYLYAGVVHKQTFNLTSDEFIYLVLPMYHIFGFINLASTIFNGGSIRMMDKFDPQVLLKSFEDPSMTLFCGVPSIYNMLMSQDNVESFTISPKNRLFISGAGALSPKTEQALNDRLLRGNGKTCQAYGSTEDTCAGTSNAENPVPGAIGKAMPGVNLEIVDDDGNILPPGPDNIGEIVNQSPAIMLGYLGDPEADDIINHEITDPVLRPIKGREGTWYWSGDVGYRDENGVFFLTDRSKDIAKVSERLVYPSEVEECLGQHPMVENIAVIGVPHETYGEQLMAVVVPTKSLSEMSDEDVAQLQKELEELGNKELAKYKVPRLWEFKNQILTNSLGKVLKKEYRDKFIKKMNKGK